MDGERKGSRSGELAPLERLASHAADVEKTARGPFGYTAGKSIIADKLVKLFPAHKTYTEPFCGSAAVFFVKEPAPVEVLADTRKDVVFAHKTMKSLSKADFVTLGGMNWTATKVRFMKLRDSAPTDRLERLYKFLYLARFSFGKRHKNFDYDSAGKTAQIVKRLEKFQPRYKNATINVADYESTVGKYDGKDSFHFLDPPYAGYHNDLGESEFDEVRFRKVLDKIKGRFLVTYGVKGKLDTSGFEVKRMQQNRSIRAGVGGPAILTHLLISNFKLAKKSLGPGIEMDDVMQIVDVDDGGERIMVTGSRTSVSVPDDLAPARAWKHDDTLCAYPAEGVPVPGEARVRFLEKRWELDFTFPVNDVTVGWSLAAQRGTFAAPPAIVAKAFSVEGSRFFLPLTQGVGACETPREALAEAVVKIDAPEVELGLQTESSHEYFLSKGDELVGQLTVLREDRRPLGEQLPWIATLIDSKFIPNAVLKGGPMPPDGVSALPRSLERVVPAEFCYWQHRGDEARKVRDALAESRFFDGHNVAVVDGELARVVTKFEIYEPSTPVPARGEWPIAKVLEIVPSGVRLVEVFSLGADAIAKASGKGKAAVYIDAGDAGDGALGLLAKSLAEQPGHYVVTALDSDASREALAPLGRPFHFRAGGGVGADAVKRVFVTSFGVRSDDVVWLDKAKSPRELLETLGPPPQWSGAVAAAIGPANRAVMQAAWRELSSSEKKKVQEAFERNFSKSDMVSGGPGTLVPAVDEPKKKPHHLSVVKAETDGDEHIVFGIVLEPDVVDAQKDVYSAAEVRDAAHRYMAEFQNRGLMHKELVNSQVDLLESYLAPAAFSIGDQAVKKGTWLMAMRVKDAKLWGDCKKGNLTGFSIGGSANRQVDPKATSKYYARKADAKKKVEFQGIPIVIDRPKGFVQEGRSEDGKPWSRTYKTDYGYIPRTKGGDGEGLDVFIGPDAESDAAFWVLQKKGDGSFDEYKLFLGWKSPAEAKKVYEEHVPPKYFAGMHEGTVQQIRALLNQEPEESLAKALSALACEEVDAAVTF